MRSLGSGQGIKRKRTGHSSVFCRVGAILLTPLVLVLLMFDPSMTI